MMDRCTLNPRLLTAGPRVVALMRWMVEHGHRCYLCHGEPAVAGCFIPNDQESCQAPPGKTRTYWYMLCEVCLARPGTQDRAEGKILREIACCPATPEVN